MAKINLPQKFPQWFSGQTTQYTPDIIRTRNVRINELATTGEVDVNNYLSLTNGYSSLVSSIFRDPNHLISFATKDKLYYIDSLKNPTITEYSPTISSGHYINPSGTGVLVYPRGYPNIDYGPTINSSGTVASSDINTFVDVPDRSRYYSYTPGRKVIAVKFVFSYTQSSGTNITRLVIVDANGTHVVATEPAHSYGRSWVYWVVDGTNGCNLNLQSGFTAKVQVATNSSSNPISFYNYSGDEIDFVEEVGSTQLLIDEGDRIYARFYNTSADDRYRAWYPGATVVSGTGGIIFGNPYNSSIFSANYPTVMKMFNDKILLIGNANSIHEVDISGYATTSPGGSNWDNVLNLTMGTFTINRLVLPNNYVIKWIECSHDTVYIGATQYNPPFNEIGKSVVLLWQPATDRQEMYDVLEGENVGKVINNFLYILTSKGNIKILYNGQFVQLAKIYQTTENYNIPLPHINGVITYQNNIAYLIPGNKYVPSGIYVFDTDTKQVYHKHSIYYSTSNLYDYGGNQPQVTTGALAYFNDNGEDVFFAGVSNVLKENGTFISGLFDSINSKNNSLTPYGYLETARIKTQEISQFVYGLGLKYRGFGSIMISEKKQETIGSCYDGIYSGTWSGNSDPSTFTMTTVPSIMKIGDRITVLDGLLRGFTTIIKGINGTTITIDPPSTYSYWIVQPTGSFNFLLESFGYSGTLINQTTLSVSSNVALLLEVGDELEFISGLGAGLVNYVASINGNNITLLNPMPYVANNYVVFLIDKYKYLDTVSNSNNEKYSIIQASNEPLDSDFVQFKLMLKGGIRVRDIQTNVKPNQTISDDERSYGRISRKKS
jgi:hypothetical protein